MVYYMTFGHLDYSDIFNQTSMKLYCIKLTILSLLICSVVNSELVGISLALMRAITIATQGGNHSLSRCFENQ